MAGAKHCIFRKATPIGKLLLSQQIFSVKKERQNPQISYPYFYEMDGRDFEEVTDCKDQQHDPKLRRGNWYCKVCLVYSSLLALFASEVRHFALYIPATGIFVCPSKPWGGERGWWSCCPLFKSPIIFGLLNNRGKANLTPNKKY